MKKTELKLVILSKIKIINLLTKNTLSQNNLIFQGLIVRWLEKLEK